MRPIVKWEGEKVSAQMALAARAGVTRCMKKCVEHAKADHPDFPPASEPYERYANRSHDLTESIQIFENPDVAELRSTLGTFLPGHPKIVEGSWGSDWYYALFLEIGTSWSGPTAEEREHAGAGNAELPLWGDAPPENTKMAPRPYLRPAADIEYPQLATYIATFFELITTKG